jgi:hypothetical protein
LGIADGNLVELFESNCIKNENTGKAINGTSLAIRQQELLRWTHLDLVNLIIAFFQKSLSFFLIQIFNDKNILNGIANIPLSFIPYKVVLHHASIRASQYF